MELGEIKKILDKEAFECALTPPTAVCPFERLLVFLALDMNKRERILEISLGQQQISPELKLSKEAKFPLRLEFRVKLPFKVQDMALSQVAHLLHFLNQRVDLPGFELNELEGEVFYRYVWLTEPEFITPSLIMNIVGAVMLNLGLFSETIESLAEGKISFNDLLSQIISITENAKASHKRH